MKKLICGLTLIFLLIQESWAMWEEEEKIIDIHSSRIKLSDNSTEQADENVVPLLSNIFIKIESILPTPDTIPACEQENFQGSKEMNSFEIAIASFYSETTEKDLTSSKFWDSPFNKRNRKKKAHNKNIITYRKGEKELPIIGITRDQIYKQSFNTQYSDHKLAEKIYVSSEVNQCVHHAFTTFNESDLVIFDVDDTLIYFLDPFYIEHVIKDSPLYQRCLESKNNVFDNFFNWLMTTAPCSLIESHTPQLVSSLQQQGTKVIALTALRSIFSQRESELLYLPAWRVKHLKELGFDFQKSLPPIPPLGWRFDSKFTQHPPEPYFEKGILFSGMAGKPNTLLNFLRTISFKPKKILFIDDFIENVVSVYRDLTRVGIKCYSVLYTRARTHSIESTFSIEEFQSYLKKQEKYLKRKL